ncbi:hypothetical protein A33Q_3572 [Indibacter alkaliphilus LW1]|uniref:TTHB210-like domain-containing protein n=1 Tax=Indibacter alkaliphilus (strain CCUG 57479 / KCTC 22604 / LW1) TaxID=1189612 RepID=S2DNV6_INDAL|nr:DUF5602 domain-containing protein [Indibacter alkaliphilus]EOZ93626.1 hypothetical protein A33Q_3572 [Indibacter alkaliphilus LW1]
MYRLPNYSFASLLGLILALFFSSCELVEKENPLVVKEPISGFTTYYGPATKMGNGKIQSFVTYNKARKPIAFGIKMNEKSLENLPTGSHAHGSLEYKLKLPNQAATLPYKHIVVDWAPEGHQPEGIYDLPHFDIHFYTISEAEREQITGLTPDQMDTEIPLAKYLPENYIQLPGRVPKMGVHWMNPLGPEFQGETFTKTLIYGTSKSKVAFLEPMITLDYIKSKPNAYTEIPQPEAVEESGYYPKKYYVGYDTERKEYVIYLSDFEYLREDEVN